MGYPPKSHHTTQPARTPLPREARRELALIFALFITMRLMCVWWFRPLYSEAAGFFLPFAYLQDAGYYPFFDYWLEYPPVLAYFIVALRAIAVAICGRGSVAWQALCLTRIVQIGSIACETGALALLYAMAKMLRGHKSAARACWIYIALFSTAFVTLSYLDALPVLLMLAAIVFAVYSRPMWAALTVAAGFMTKVFPIGILPTVLKCEARWRWRLAPLGVFLLFVAYFAAPFAVTGSHWLACSAESTVRRPGWQTVWALIEGRSEFGYVGPRRVDQTPRFFEPERHGIVPGTAALLKALPLDVYGPPPVRRTVFYRVASRFARKLDFLGAGPQGPARWIYGAAGIAVALFFLVTSARLPAALPPRRRLTYAAFTMFLLFFYAKGWSPQFVAYLIPLLLIAFPETEAGLWCLLLTVVAFIEMPLWAVHLHGHAGMAVADRLVLQATVIARTALLLVIITRLYRRLWND